MVGIGRLQTPRERHLLAAQMEEPTILLEDM